MDALDKIIVEMLDTTEAKSKSKPSQHKNRMRIDDIKEHYRLEKELQDYDFGD